MNSTERSTEDESPGAPLLLRRRLAAVPALREAQVEMASWRDVPTEESLLRAGSLLRGLIGGPFLTELVNFELEQIATNPRYLPPGRFGTAALLEVDGWELAMTTGPPFPIGSSAVLSSIERDIAFGVAGGPAVPFTRYRFLGISDWEVFDRSARLVRQGSTALQPGDVVTLDSAREIIEPVRPPASTVLTLASPPRRAFAWEFDRSSLRAYRLVIADLAATRIAYAPELLVQLESTGSVPVLEELTMHPRHFVRWNAVKALCALDAKAGLRALEAARTDAHPHVRRAAEASLANVAAQDVA